MFNCRSTQNKMGLSLSNHFYNFKIFFLVGPLRAANRNYTIFCLFVFYFFVVLEADDGDMIAIITSHLFISFFFSFSGKMTAKHRKQFFWLAQKIRIYPN